MDPKTFPRPLVFEIFKNSEKEEKSRGGLFERKGGRKNERTKERNRRTVEL